MIDKPGAPFALHCHAAIDGDHSKAHRRDGERQEDQCLSENGVSVFHLDRIEDVAVPNVQPVLNTKLDEDEHKEAYREQPCCHAGLLEPESSGGRPIAANQSST